MRWRRLSAQTAPAVLETETLPAVAAHLLPIDAALPVDAVELPTEPDHVEAHERGGVMRHSWCYLMWLLVLRARSYER